jgi:hypothetical protein
MAKAETAPPTPDVLTAVITEAKRVEEDSLHSSKGHFEAASRWDVIHLWCGVPAAVAATVTATAAGIAGLGNHAQLAGGIALVSAALTAAVAVLKPKDRALAHHHAGTAFNALKNGARIFHQIECIDPSMNVSAVANVKLLDAQRAKLNSESPPIPRFAFKAAKAGIDAGQAEYAADGQINA